MPIRDHPTPMPTPPARRSSRSPRSRDHGSISPYFPQNCNFHLFWVPKGRKNTAAYRSPFSRCHNVKARCLQQPMQFHSNALRKRCSSQPVSALYDSALVKLLTPIARVLPVFQGCSYRCSGRDAICISLSGSCRFSWGSGHHRGRRGGLGHGVDV